MAKATVVRAEAPIEKVTLELSHEEAQALVNVLGAMTAVAKAALNNQPGAQGAVYYALIRAGMTCTYPAGTYLSAHRRRR